MAARINFGKHSPVSAMLPQRAVFQSRHGLMLSRSMRPAWQPRAVCRIRRRESICTRAMVNVDVSPSLILGCCLITGGLGLYQIRRSNPYISKDVDVVISCISIFSGGILVFQGWRLDPILLFNQLLTAGTALCFAVEALQLRSMVANQQKDAIQQGVDDRVRDTRSVRNLPSAQTSSYREWNDDREGAGDGEAASSVSYNNQTSQRWEDDEWETERQYSAGSSTAEDDRNYAQDSNQGGFSGNDTWPGTSPIPGQPSAAAGNRAARRGPIDLDTVDDWD